MIKMDYERKWWIEQTLVVGMDEVGRGCVAGPVIVAAVVFPFDHKIIEGINDSKKLSIKKREILERIIRERALKIGIGVVEAEIIDQVGIVAAITKAANTALREMKLEARYMIVSDGPKPIHSPVNGIKSDAVIDGDAKIYSVAAASIVAKVYRDKVMKEYAGQFAGYGWETNVGYGTRKHYEAIDKWGLTPLHRRSFLAKYKTPGWG